MRGIRYNGDFTPVNIGMVVAKLGYSYEYGDIAAQRTQDKAAALAAQAAQTKRSPPALLALTDSSSESRPDVKRLALTDPSRPDVQCLKMMTAGPAAQHLDPYQVHFDSACRAWKIVDLVANKAAWYPIRGLEPQLSVNSDGVYFCTDSDGGHYRCSSLFRGETDRYLPGAVWPGLFWVRSW